MNYQFCEPLPERTRPLQLLLVQFGSLDYLILCVLLQMLWLCLRWLTEGCRCHISAECRWWVGLVSNIGCQRWCHLRDWCILQDNFKRRKSVPRCRILPFEPEDADRIIISNTIFLFLSLDLKRMNCEVPIWSVPSLRKRDPPNFKWPLIGFKSHFRRQFSS